MFVGRAWSCGSISTARPSSRSRAPGRRPGARACGAVAAGAILFAANPAAAAEARPAFDIPAQPLRDALVAFGLQAGVSVGAGDLTGCRPNGRPVTGRHTPAAALRRLLDGTGCGFRAVDARAFSVSPSPVEPPARPPETTAPVGDSAAEILLDLTVTTSRRPSLVSRTPASVSLASGEALSAGRIESLHDLAPEFAGVTITNLGPGRNKVLVRGLSDGAFTGRTQSTVGLYLDDVPITYNAPDPDLRLVDVQRVELMRGPQGSLYGVGSMGGIVRIVTNKPDLQRFDYGFAAGAALTEGGAGSGSLDLMANVPAVPGRLAVRGVAYSEVVGGYVDDTALSLKNANRTRRTGGRLALTAAPNPDWQATIGFTRQSLRSDDSQYAEGDIGRLQRDGRVREPHDNDFVEGYASVDGSGPWGRLRLSAALLTHDFATRSDATAGVALFGAPGRLGSFDQDDRVELAVTEAVLTSPPGRRLQWLAGLFLSRTTEKLHLDLSAFDAAGRRTLYLEDRRDRIGDTAIYGEVSYALTPTLSVTAGARAFRASLSTLSLRHQIGLVLTFADVRKNTDLSPKAVLSWQPSATKLFYLQAAQGYRTGGFNTTGRINQQFNAGATGNQPNRRYRPDTLWSYEAGAKVSFPARRLDLRAAVFYTDWRDVQSDQFLPSGLPYTANVGRGVNTGLEGEAALRLEHDLTFRLNFLANGPQLRQRDTTYPARPNASLPAVPRYSAALIGDWRPEIAPGLRAVLYGRIGYVGSSILTFQEQASSAMGNYVTARFAAGLEKGRWRLTAFVDNPANAEGDTFAFGDPFTQGRVRQSTPLRPRTFGLTLAAGL